ncbi:hypothetical protein RCH09_003647 [Actimicrobium sp. GrIS 1.19]|uniref:HAD domain-containing protein n=1 Tax=Actimicrobium sp. GrIS 1.19 TaxID=3071708 RepID=UPI002DF904A2|nr:hypothetical protein [Actimicrobium sp. GrIS 1.19]
MILFLDFDGVLHLEFIPGITPGRARVGEEHFTHLPAFEAVVRDFPGVDIVISSTWRLRHSLDELRAFFSPDIAGRIIGVTPELPRNHPERREGEIRQWLDGAGRTDEPFLAIDDWPPLFSQDFDALFWVSPEEAFDDAAALRLRAILREFA